MEEKNVDKVISDNIETHEDLTQSEQEVKSIAKSYIQEEVALTLDELDKVMDVTLDEE